MNETARKPRVAGFALFTLFLTAVCIVLGIWQLQRRIAKHELIAALTERLAEAPVALPTPARWAALSPARDHVAIASALGWGAVAPFYVDLEQPAPENGIPRPGPLDVHLKDDHLQYAITWFTLAGAVLIAFAVWARGRRRG